MSNFSGQNISANKIFGGQNFRQQIRFSAVLFAEILSDKVIQFCDNRLTVKKFRKSLFGRLNNHPCRNSLCP